MPSGAKSAAFGATISEPKRTRTIARESARRDRCNGEKGAARRAQRGYGSDEILRPSGAGRGDTDVPPASERCGGGYLRPPWREVHRWVPPAGWEEARREEPRPGGGRHAGRYLWPDGGKRGGGNVLPTHERHSGEGLRPLPRGAAVRVFGPLPIGAAMRTFGPLPIGTAVRAFGPPATGSCNGS